MFIIFKNTKISHKQNFRFKPGNTQNLLGVILGFRQEIGREKGEENNIEKRKGKAKIARKREMGRREGNGLKIERRKTII